MNASYDWLKAFVPFELTPGELRDLITSRCATVDEVIPLRADLAQIVVARVVEAKRHPNSDRLWLTKVDPGNGGIVDVVCGAPNVEEGRLYPFAAVGTRLPGGVTIERKRIRGETSAGMLCSARELGLGDEHDGIMTLDVDVPPGTPFLQALAVGDSRIVIDVAPNRPDLLSHVGIAREIAAAIGLPLTLPAIPASADGGQPTVGGVPDGERPFTVEIADGADASRYAGVEIRGVRVGPSPAWLGARLEAVGSRSINNVVDATNYVMHELGQPLHAFDADKLAGRRVVVRRARPGERLVTLDGVDRALAPEITVIADAERAQAVAGVMGGAESEVTGTTTSVFLESANFDPGRTRATRRQLNLPTDASYRFERGVDPELAPFALERAVRVIVAIAGGSVGRPIDVRPRPTPPTVIPLRVDRITALLGVPISGEEVALLLQSVAFGVASADAPGTLRVEVPSWRGDVRREIDLIEEVARLRGYDTFPDELRPFRPGTVPDAPVEVIGRRLRDALVAEGLLETRPMPFVAGGAEGYVRVTNPVAENEAYLRMGLLESLARAAEHNLARMQGNVRLFEIGTAFAPSPQPLPHEEVRVAALIMGERRPPHFTEPKPPAFDEWDAKALAETILGAAFPHRRIPLHPGEGDVLWQVHLGDELLGTVRRVRLDAPVWAGAAFGVEITLARVSAAVGGIGRGRALVPVAAEVGNGAGVDASAVRYRPLATTPAVEFDLALVVPDRLTAADVEAVIRREAGDLLERLALFDQFRGPGMAEGHRSLAWRLTFRHPERTLREKEVDARRQKLLRTLESELGVRQRG
jgi:phenylalanyl-tRNA synthetase beta chain